MTVLNCTVEQTSKGTMYNVPEINGTDCNFSWVNGTDNVNLMSSCMVSSNITTLIMKCYKSIHYILKCMTGGTYEAACTANCTKNSGLSVGAWVGIVIAVVIVLAAIALVKKKRCSSQARSANHQPDARYKSRNNEESVELNANRSHEQP